MGFFATKIVCDQCNKKTKEDGSLYRRGSRFCNAGCADAYDAANPAPVAGGDPVKLRAELAMLIDQAIVESKRSFDPTFSRQVGANTTVSVDLGGGLGGIDDRAAAEQAQSSRELFQTYVLRAAPILRALGFAPTAMAIDSNDFMKNAGYQLAGQLEQIRHQL